MGWILVLLKCASILRQEGQVFRHGHNQGKDVSQPIMLRDTWPSLTVSATSQKKAGFFDPTLRARSAGFETGRSPDKSSS
jgi:hypothetical protein